MCYSHGKVNAVSFCRAFDGPDNTPVFDGSSVPPLTDHGVGLQGQEVGEDIVQHQVVQ